MLKHCNFCRGCKSYFPVTKVDAVDIFEEYKLYLVVSGKENFLYTVDYFFVLPSGIIPAV